MSSYLIIQQSCFVTKKTKTFSSAAQMTRHFIRNLKFQRFRKIVYFSGAVVFDKEYKIFQLPHRFTMQQDKS